MFSNIAHKLQIKLEKDLRVLRYLFLEITRICNLSCRHCGSDCQSSTDAKELTTDQWLSFLNYIKETFPANQMALVITGGEPLSRPGFFTLTEQIGQLGLYWGMVTNGYLYNDNAIQKSIEHGIRALTISLDGLRDSHNYLRNRNNGYDALLPTIQTVANIPEILFDIVTCVYPGNLESLDQLAELLIKQGVRRWRLFSITAKGRAGINKELILNIPQWQKMIDWIKTRRKDLKKAGLEINFSCEGYFKPKVNRAIRDFPYFCRAGVNIASVLCDGSIMACPNISHQLIQGNILKDDFKSVWEDKFIPYYKRDWLKKGPCATCKEWKRCQGNSLHLYDDFDETPFCHFHNIS